MSQELVLYVKAGCPWCIEAVDYLQKHGYRFREVEVRSNPAAFEEMRRISGQTKAPTLTVNGHMLPDFDTRQLARFLSTHNIVP